MAVAHTKNTNAGFTLVEVLLSLGIVSAALITLLMIRNDNIRQADHANALSRAELMASAKIEEIVLSLKQDGRLSATSGRLGGEDSFRWEAEARRTEVPNVGPMWHVTMKVFYPVPEGTGEFRVNRLVPRKNEERR